MKNYLKDRISIVPLDKYDFTFGASKDNEKPDILKKAIISFINANERSSVVWLINLAACEQVKALSKDNITNYLSQNL